MTKIAESQDALTKLGERLRAARLRRNDTMAIFAQRLGVNVSTVRDMERGAPTVRIGTWVDALSILDSLDEVDALLAERVSLVERAIAEERGTRRMRASPRRRP